MCQLFLNPVLHINALTHGSRMAMLLTSYLSFSKQQKQVLTMLQKGS